MNGEVLETYVDTSQLDKLKSLKYHWHACWQPEVQSYYAKTSVYFEGCKNCTTFYLHKIVTDTSGIEYYVDHIDHNTLDNRLENLRVSLRKDNSTNRKSRNRNNQSGYRNVFWCNTSKRWLVRLQIDGKTKELGRFKDVDEAGRLAEEMRQKYYKDYAGAS